MKRQKSQQDEIKQLELQLRQAKKKRQEEITEETLEEIKQLFSADSTVEKFQHNIAILFSEQLESFQIVSNSEFNSERGNNLQSGRYPTLFKMIFDGANCRWGLEACGQNGFSKLKLYLLLQNEEGELRRFEHAFSFMGHAEDFDQSRDLNDEFSNKIVKEDAWPMLFKIVAKDPMKDGNDVKFGSACRRVFFGMLHAFIYQYLVTLKRNGDEDTLPIEYFDRFWTAHFYACNHVRTW